MKKKIIFLTGLIYFIIFISPYQTIPYFEPSITPKNSSLNEILLKYSVDYEIDNEYGHELGNFNMQMLINGSQGLSGNGTIDYLFQRENNAEILLQSLDSVSGVGYIFKKGLTDGNISSHFSYRREIFLTTDFDYGTYTFFWLNRSNNNGHQISLKDNIPFFEVQSPRFLTIDDETALLATKGWGSELKDLRQNCPLLETFYIRFQMSYYNEEEMTLGLYYDLQNTILVRMSLDYKSLVPESDVAYKISISLEETNLILQYISPNPYWEEWKIQLIIGSGIGGITCIVILIVFFKKRKKTP